MSLSFYILSMQKIKTDLENEINFIAQSTFDKRVNQVDTSGGMVFIFYFWNTGLYTCNRQSPQKGFRPIISILSKKNMMTGLYLIFPVHGRQKDVILCIIFNVCVRYSEGTFPLVD